MWVLASPRVQFGGRNYGPNEAVDGGSLRLEQCAIDTTGAFVISPVQRTEPEKRWTDARDSKAIPPKLYELYKAAGFLSFGSGIRYLTDDRNILFSYFGLILNCLADSFVSADKELAAFVAQENLTYDPGKKSRGERWEPDAPIRARKHFRDLLIALDASLDTLADLVAIFLTGRISGIQLGRGDFRKIENWIGQPLRPPGLVSTPYDGHLRKLYASLKPLVCPGAPEKDWLPLMHMLRNKSIHIGEGVLRRVGLHDADKRFYVFLPRKWPFIWERDFEPHDSGRKAVKMDLRAVFSDLLMHQDILTFAGGLRAKVMDVAEAALSEILDMYRAFRTFDTNRDALAELERNSVTYKFEHFL